MTNGAALDFGSRVEARRERLRRRQLTRHAEHFPPTGQAGYWYDEAIQDVPRSGQAVARQLARLCGDDSKVIIPWRSLADAVGEVDKAGRLVAYTERGAATLTESGWLRIETLGRGRASRTTFYLQVPR